jgi:hypothetical protein
MHHYILEAGKDRTDVLWSHDSDPFAWHFVAKGSPQLSSRRYYWLSITCMVKGLARLIPLASTEALDSVGGTKALGLIHSCPAHGGIL